MPTTRPGYVWSGIEWISIGQEAAVSPFKYQATAPTSPATGDIWIESDVDVPSIDSSQFLRWRKTMAGGETSLSGNDDLSLSLAYTPGYEQLYINGVLQVRGGDYTATTGTTVTGLTALAANDVVEVFSAVARVVADVYTQTQSDTRYATQTNFPAGAWTSYTPSTANLTIGNGTLTGRYMQFGKTVFYSIKFTLGSTSAIGAAPSIGIPPIAAQSSSHVGGSAQFIDTSPGNIWAGIHSINGGGQILSPNSTSYYGNLLTSTTPFTWATGDSISITGTYEAA